MKIIIYKNSNQNVSVCYPTGEIPIEDVLKKDCPEGAFIIDSSELPEEHNEFFNAWKLDNNNKIPNTETDFWTRNFDFKSIDFLADRYLIDVIDGEIEDKYLAFPQRGEKLP